MFFSFFLCHPYSSHWYTTPFVIDIKNTVLKKSQVMLELPESLGDTCKILVCSFILYKILGATALSPSHIIVEMNMESWYVSSTGIKLFKIQFLFQRENCLLIIKNQFLKEIWMWLFYEWRPDYFPLWVWFFNGQKGSSAEVYFSWASVHLPQSHS